jgi:Bacterial Ig-like domain (group 1)
MRIALITIAVAVTALWAASSPGSALAQYPEQVGAIEATTAATSAPAGGTTTVSCRVRDADGAPVEGAPVAFTLTANPGDAALSTSQVTSGADGTASVEVSLGSHTGTVQVACSSEDKTSVVLVDVVLGETNLPPAAPIEPPNTGDGGLLGGGSSAPSALLLLTGLGLLAAGWTFAKLVRGTE